MESKAKYLFVGIVVSILIVLGVLSILWVADVGKGEKVKFFTVYFREQGLSGLQTDSTVTMKGIKVGTVTEFAIMPSDVERVRVVLKIAENTPVKVDTRAVIKRNLLTGLANIELTETTNYSPLLVDVPPGERFPVVLEGQTKLDQIASTIPGLIDDTSKLVARANGIVSDDNLKNISATLANLERFTAFLSSNADNFEATAKSLRTFSEDGQHLAASLDKLSRDADKNLESTVKQLNATLKQIEITAKTLDEQSKVVTSSAFQAFDRLTFEIGGLSKDLAVAAQAFANAMEQFENPRAIIIGPPKGALGPGEVNRGAQP